MTNKAVFGVPIVLLLVLIAGGLGVYLLYGFGGGGGSFLSTVGHCEGCPTRVDIKASIRSSEGYLIKNGVLYHCWQPNQYDITCTSYPMSQGWSQAAAYCPDGVEGEYMIHSQYQVCVKGCNGTCTEYENRYGLHTFPLEGECVTLDHDTYGGKGLWKIQEHIPEDSVRSRVGAFDGKAGLVLGSHYYREGTRRLTAGGYVYGPPTLIRTRYCVMGENRLYQVNAEYAKNGGDPWEEVGDCNCNKDSDCGTNYLCNKTGREWLCQRIGGDIPAPPDPRSYLEILWEGLVDWIQDLFGMISLLSMVDGVHSPGEPVVETLEVTDNAGIDKDYSDGTVRYLYAKYAIYGDGSEIESSDWIEVDVLPYSHTFSYTPTHSGEYAYVLVLAVAESTFDDTTATWTLYQTNEADKRSYSFRVGASGPPPGPGPGIFDNIWQGILSAIKNLFGWL